MGMRLSLRYPRHFTVWSPYVRWKFQLLPGHVYIRVPSWYLFWLSSTGWRLQRVKTVRL